MSSKYYGDLVFSTGEYEQNGETKKRWSKAGAVFRDSETGRMSIKFEAMPVGEWSGWMNIFEKKEQSAQNDDERHPTHKEMIDNGEPIDLSEIPF